MNVSMVDIAKKLGVSQSTVSLALNNSPKASAATIARVKAVAEEMGYQVNPYVSALMTSRRHGKNPENLPVVALITATETPDEWKNRYNTNRFVEGCTNVARSLGIRIEHFWIGEDSMSAKRMNDILYNQGIRGAVLLPAGPWREKMDYAWTEIATVSYGIYELTPNTDWLTADYYGNMEKTLKILRNKNATKIGYIMEIPYPYKNDNRWLAAYHMAQKRTPAGQQIEPWLDPEPTFDGFRRWVEETKPEVIICVRPATVIGWLEQMGLKVPDDMGVVTVGTAEENGDFSGIIEKAYTCGKLAVEMLLERIHHNQFGQFESPHHITIGGHWNRGKTLHYDS